jgi:hypothetical protein
MVVTVTQCAATGDMVPDDPWNDANTQVMIACTTETTGPGFCTGRRPQGHREAATSVVSVGTWLAVHAHLERASVVAFEELAHWLQRRGAPADLVRRCREAAADEVRHAAVMTALADEAGVPVPDVRHDRPDDDVYAVALHNAVEGCVREAFAAIVAVHQSREAAPELRATFEAIAEDELRHGQLAWHLHRWLMSTLDAGERASIETAQAAALAELPIVAADNARRTPARMGWPKPARAAAMAQRFMSLARTLA